MTAGGFGVTSSKMAAVANWLPARTPGSHESAFSSYLPSLTEYSRPLSQTCTRQTITEPPPCLTAGNVLVAFHALPRFGTQRVPRRYGMSAPSVWCVAGTESLKLERVSVPQYVLVGDSVVLQCVFELGSDRLYSVTWYKDHEQFFHYVPRSTPSLHLYPLQGVSVNVSTPSSTPAHYKLVKEMYFHSERCKMASPLKEAPWDMCVTDRENGEIQTSVTATYMRILKQDLHFHLMDVDKAAREQFCGWLLSNIAPEVLQDGYVLFSDEAWFHLAGYSNSQNMRHWLGDNPHVLTEAPLHPQKLGVWCAVSSQLLASSVHLPRGQWRPLPAPTLDILLSHWTVLPHYLAPLHICTMGPLLKGSLCICEAELQNLSRVSWVPRVWTRRFSADTIESLLTSWGVLASCLLPAMPYLGLEPRGSRGATGCRLPVCVCVAGTESLKLERVSVPQYVLVGDSVVLQCVFELGSDRLYSVTWYKDHEQFFHYVPRSPPPPAIKPHYKLIKGMYFHSDERPQIKLRPYICTFLLPPKKTPFLTRLKYCTFDVHLTTAQSWVGADATRRRGIDGVDRSIVDGDVRAKAREILMSPAGSSGLSLETLPPLYAQDVNDKCLQLYTAVYRAPRRAI
ncbi:hypothetical protein PR048_000147 [Dryococelus australis]|uniref:Ig-like domain-containing protein n=1 Tax=Dryococelus australis TaxID=614101 RepID=A0ABQ9IDU6_9NEOP|nr:hypothetical protein PR048_000147 [Dryococelus australis]